MTHKTTSMYQSYFGLSEAPFSIAPDPRYLYMSKRHQEALATLLFGLGSDGGFVLLTGDVGAGKTTICRSLLEQIPEACDVAYIFNPKLTVVELLSSICDEFGIAYPAGNASIKLFVDLINSYLLDAHAKVRRAVLIIDEAQNLSADVLEQLRLLTNLETNERKLLQIILLGQPELATMLERPDLRQLAQRIVARYHLGPLTKAEVESYVRHRLELSGARRQLVPRALMGKLHRLSKGVPRVINVLCDRALLGAYVEGKDRVDRATLKQAAREVFNWPAASRQYMLLAGLVLTALGILAAGHYRQNPRESEVPEAQDTSAKSAALSMPAIPVLQPIGARIESANEPAALPAKLEWPMNVPQSASRTLAHAALFRAWGADYREGTDICQLAASAGLTCRTARGGLADLYQMNRPAVLHLHDDHGGEFDATLTKLDDNAATFAIGSETRAVALGALASQWSGDYTLLWRAPPNIDRSIRGGERGEAVGWLRKQLASVQGRDIEAGKDSVFDDALMLQLKQFQLAQGIVPDGVAGLQTLVRLSTVADKSAPKLLTTRDEK